MTPIAGLEGLKGDTIIPNYSYALPDHPDYMDLGGYQKIATFTLASWTELADEKSAPYREVDANKGLPMNLAIEADTYVLTNATMIGSNYLHYIKKLFEHLTKMQFR